MIDVIRIIVELYYTPILTSNIKDTKFYINFEYPFGNIKLQLPHIANRFGKSTRYLTEHIDTFIKAIDNNIKGKLEMINPFLLDINIDKNNINFNNEEIDINIKNTDKSRNQLINVMNEYLDYMECYDW